MSAEDRLMLDLRWAIRSRCVVGLIAGMRAADLHWWWARCGEARATNDSGCE